MGGARGTADWLRGLGARRWVGIGVVWATLAGCDPAAHEARVPARGEVGAASGPQTSHDEGGGASSASGPVTTDPEGVPNHGPATTCLTSTGDARAARIRLRAVARGREPAPADSASLLADCGATAREVATALEKGGRAIARAAGHDHARAAAYFRRAIEIDPSYPEARLALAGARAKLGDVDGAFHQLEQMSAAGTLARRARSRAFRDGALASLRLLPRFWAWAGDPIPDAVAALSFATPEPVTSVGGTLAFAPAPELARDVIFAPVPLAGTQYLALVPAVQAAVGLRAPRPRGVPRDAPKPAWIEQLDALGLVSLARPSAFRFGDGAVVLAIPFAYGDALAPEMAVLVARGPESGPFEVLRVLTPDERCAHPSAFTSRDRRILGFFTSCDEGADPTTFGRCVFYGENGRLLSRCTPDGSVAGYATATDAEGRYDEEADSFDGSSDGEAFGDEDEAYEDWGE